MRNCRVPTNDNVQKDEIIVRFYYVCFDMKNVIQYLYCTLNKSSYLRKYINRDNRLKKLY